MSGLQAAEISEIIANNITGLKVDTPASNTGTIISVADGIAKIYGLSDVGSGEMIEFPGNVYGLALNLEQDAVGAVILGDYENISAGQTVTATGRILEVPVGEALIGRVVDALGNAIDGKAK